MARAVQHPASLALLDQSQDNPDEAARLRGEAKDRMEQAFENFEGALQPSHRSFYTAIVETTQERWAGQIQHWELIRAQQAAPADRSAAARLRVG
jgi:hypothetical protein